MQAENAEQIFQFIAVS